LRYKEVRTVRVKIGRDVLKQRTKPYKQKRTGDWHVVFWDLSVDYPKIITEVVSMEEAPTSRHAVAIAQKRLRETGRMGKIKSVGFVDR